jgi:hypothetical protein
MKRKLYIFILSLVLFFMLSSVNLVDSVKSVNSDNSQFTISFSKTYSIDNEEYDKPTFRASLIDKLDKLVKKHGINGVFNPYSPEKAVQLIETYSEDIKQYSKYYNIPYEMIMAVLFREIICLSWDDTLLDNVKETVIGNASIGLSQNGVKRAKDALLYVTGNEYSDSQVKDMLNDEKESIFITVIYIHKIAKSMGIRLNELKQKDIEYVFGRYNSNPNTKLLYGQESYSYYKLFCEYKSLF